MKSRPSIGRIITAVAVLISTLSLALWPQARLLLASQGYGYYVAYTPPPSVVSRQPADGAAGVPLDQPIQVQFDRPMDPDCPVDLADGFGNAALPGTLTWTQTLRAGDTLVFVPAEPGLRHSLTYRLTYQCRDTHGVPAGGYERPQQLRFSTAGAPGDQSAPQVLSTAPFNTQTGGVTWPIRIAFDKPMAPGTMTPWWVLMPRPAGTGYRLAPDGFMLDIWPLGLTPQAQYQVDLTPVLADGDGHRLPLRFSFGFHTGAGDTVAPSVVETRPADEALALPWEPVSVFFSEGMDPGRFDTLRVRVLDETDGEVPVGIHLEKSRVSGEGRYAKLEIDRAFEEGGRWEPGHRYRVELAADLADLAGNPLGTAEVFRFDVAAAVGPGAADAPPDMIGEGDCVAYRDPDGRTTLDLTVNAASSTGDALTVTVADLTQPGKVWNDLSASDGRYVYQTPEGIDEALTPGLHELFITVTDPANGEQRTLSRTVQVFDAVPVPTGGPADGAVNVPVQPSFTFATTGISTGTQGAAAFSLSITEVATGERVYRQHLFPNGTESYRVMVPQSQALTPDTEFEWSVAALDALDHPGGEAHGEVRTFTTGHGGPALWIDDLSQAEGQGGQTLFTFTVNLYPPSVGTVTVRYDTADGTATAGSDYTAVGGTLSFDPGQTRKQVTVNVNGDGEVEADEVFTLALSAPVGASLLGDRGQGSILNDDFKGAISGRISGADGGPLQDAAIYLYSSAYGGWQFARYGEPDAGGNYRFDDLGLGSYRVCVQPWDWSNAPGCYDGAPDLASATDVPVTHGQTTQGIDIELLPPGKIAGTVTDADDNPLEGIEVRLYYRYGNGGIIEWDYAQTGPDGRYEIGPLPAGVQSGLVCLRDWQGRYAHECYDNAASASASTDIPVTAGRTTTGIDARLEPGGAISGTLTDESGNPLGGIEVEVFAAARSGQWNTVGGGRSSGDGTYEIVRLLPGDYRVCFLGNETWVECYNNVATLDQAQAVPVVGGRTTDRIDASLAAAGRISGRVTDATGAPLAAVWVVAVGRLIGRDEGFSSEGMTGIDGTYEIGAITGSYRLAFNGIHSDYVSEWYDNATSFSTATEIPVTAGRTTTGIDAQLSAGGIAGTVTGAAGEPLVAQVEVYAWNAGSWQLSTSTWAGWYGDGAYSVALPAGIYRVCFTDYSGGNYVPECYDNAATVGTATDVTVGEVRKTSGIDARLSAPGAIVGSLTGDAGSPLAGGQVRLFARNAGSGTWDVIASAWTGMDGTYSLSRLTAGTYRLCFSDYGSTHLPECHRDAADAASGTDLVVSGGETARVDAQLTPRGRVAGRVTDTADAPLAGVYVLFRTWDAGANAWRSVNVAQTAADGTYTSPALPAGTYRACFVASAGGAFQECFDDAATIDEAADITVTDDRTTSGIDAQLERAGSITGMVTNADGNPVLDVQVSAQRWNPVEGYWQWVALDLSGPAGTYRLDGLRPGNYRVCFYDAFAGGGYAQECYEGAGDADGARDVAVVAGATTAGIDAELGTAGRIGGTLTRADGAHLEGIEVTARRWNRAGYWQDIDAWTLTGADGGYLIGGLNTGTYRVCFRDPQGVWAGQCYEDAANADEGADVPVTAGEATEGIDARLAAAGRIGGTITAAGGGVLAGIEVEAFAWNTRQGAWQPLAAVASGSDGRYELGGLAAGNYRVCFADRAAGVYGRECYAEATLVDEAREVPVSVGSLTPGIDAVLEPGGAIAGTLTAAPGAVLARAAGAIGTSVPVVGSPVSGIRARAYVYHAEQDRWAPVAETLSGPDGGYRLSGLAAGHYRVCFADEGGGRYAQECYADAGTPAAAADLMVAVGETITGIDAQLEPGGAIRGRVTGANGALLPYVQVEALAADAGAWQRIIATFTGPDGSFELGGLPTGQFRVCFTDATGTYLPECFRDADDAASGTDVAVTAGTTVPAIDARLDSADQPRMTIDDLRRAEGDAGSTAFDFTVGLSAPSAVPVMVNWATTAGTAQAGSDYQAAGGALTLAPGETSKTLRVEVLGDTLAEPDEWFAVDLSAPTAAVIGKARGIGTIENDDQSQLGIGDRRQTEGNSGRSAFDFTVVLSAPSATTVTVDYRTADGTARAGSDYTAVAGTLTFTPGQTSRTISVQVTGDTVLEPDETFFVDLSAPVGAVIADGQGLGTIVNDEPPTLSIAPVAVLEGDAGTTAAVFTVSLAQASAATVTVDYATANGTAQAGSDYTGAAGTLTFVPGETSRTVTVAVLGDTLVEADETFFVDLKRPSGAVLGSARAQGSIRNDDLPSLAVGDAAKDEGQRGTAAMGFTVTLTPAALSPVTVRYATADGSATVGSDYQAGSGLLTFTRGQSTKSVSVPIIGDTLVEADETFALELSTPTGATLGDPQGQGRIRNDDLPRVSIGAASVGEADAGETALDFTVTLDQPSPAPVAVDYASANGSAQAGSDYRGVAATLTFAPGETSRTVTVAVLGDTLVEADETFFVDLKRPSGATLGTARGQGSIRNDDLPSLAVGDAAKDEGQRGTAAMGFTVTLTPAALSPVTVRYATADGSATVGSDYQAGSGLLTFTRGQSTKSVSVPIIGDTLVEADETFTLELSTPTGATLGDPQGQGRIRNDDLPRVSIGAASVGEADAGETALDFTVTLDQPSPAPVAVDYASANGSAQAGSDYRNAAGTLTFAPGETSRTVSVAVLGDTTVEPNETVFVDLKRPSGATLGTARGQGTIRNDDGALLRIGDAELAEGQVGTSLMTFAVTLEPASSSRVTVAYATADGTASAARGDYRRTSGALTFLPGETAKTVTVPVVGDRSAEANETFFVNLSKGVGATLFDDQGQGTIRDDDTPE